MVGTTGASQMSNINRLHQGAGIFSTSKPRAIFSPALTQNQSAGPKARPLVIPSGALGKSFRLPSRLTGRSFP